MDDTARGMSLNDAQSTCCFRETLETKLDGKKVFFEEFAERIIESSGALRSLLVGLQQLIDDGDQLFWIDRLFEVKIGQWFGGLKGFSHVSGYDHDRHGRVRFRSLDDGASIGITQTPVGDDGVVSVVLQLIDGVVGRAGRGDGMSGTLENGALESDHVGFVVDA